MTYTYRDLMKDITGYASDVGDHVLDLQVTTMSGIPIDGVDYQSHEEADDEFGYSEEPEALTLSTPED